MSSLCSGDLLRRCPDRLSKKRRNDFALLDITPPKTSFEIGGCQNAGVTGLRTFAAILDTQQCRPFSLDGVPMGIRTPVLTVRGSCPRPLDDGDERLSFERHHCTT